MKKRSDETLETPLTPMIDVTFQLIIFFVVNAAQQNELIDHSLNLAQAKHAEAVKKQNPKTVTINLRSDGTLNIALMEYSLGDLRGHMKQLVAENGNSIPIVIRCDGKALYRDVDKIVEVLGQCGLYRIRIAAVVAKGG